MKPVPHANNIDALRLILSFTVLFSHSFGIAGLSASEPLIWFSSWQKHLGGVAVDWFFVLSGYLITQSWERSRGLGSFLKKRVRRIYPGYLVAVACCFFLVVPLVDGRLSIHSGRDALSTLLKTALLRANPKAEAFANLPEGDFIDGSLWTISFEFGCYLGVAVLGITRLLRLRWLVAGLFVLSIAPHFLVPYYGKLGIYDGWVARVVGYPPHWARLGPFFLAGMTAYLFREHLRYRARYAIVALGGLTAGCLIPHGLAFLMPTFGTYMILYLAFTDDWRWHGAARYGDFSYGVYLYAWPIQQLLVWRYGVGIGALGLTAAAALPTLLAGVTSWYVVERRFLRSSSRRPLATAPSPTEPTTARADLSPG